MNLSGKRILVTGAGGFIGSHLADRLAAGNELVLVDDFSIGKRENLAEVRDRKGVSIAEDDICDRERMRALTRGIDVVFHLAISDLRTSINNPLMSHDINAGGTLSVLMAAREHAVKRFIYVSSSEVYGTAETVPMSEAHPLRPTTVYGASKLAGELYALAYHRTYGLPVSVVRPFNTYGPREPYEGMRAEVIPRFHLELEAGRAPVIYGGGSQRRDFTYVEETVSGLVRAGECDALVGDVVNVAYGREVSIARIAELLAERAGKPQRAARRAEPRPGDGHRHFADISKARRLFGFEPKIGIEEGLARTVAWFEAQGITAGEDAASGRPNW